MSYWLALVKQPRYLFGCNRAPRWKEIKHTQHKIDSIWIYRILILLPATCCQTFNQAIVVEKIYSRCKVQHLDYQRWFRKVWMRIIQFVSSREHRFSEELSVFILLYFSYIYCFCNPGLHHYVTSITSKYSS